MAYNPLTAGDLVAGKPTKEEIFTTIRANQEQFASDIVLLQGTAKIDIFDIKFSGSINQYTPTEILSFVPVFKSPVAGFIVSVVITLLTPSTSGTLSIKLEKSSDNGINWNDVTTGTVDLTGTTVGSISGAVTFTDATFVQNDLIKLTIPGAQANQGEFHVSVYGELS